MNLLFKEFGDISSDTLDLREMDEYSSMDLYGEKKNDNDYKEMVSLKNFRNYTTKKVDYNNEEYTVATLEYSDGETVIVPITSKRVANVLAQLDKAKTSKALRLSKDTIKCY